MRNSFDEVWERSRVLGTQFSQTPGNKDFEAFATFTGKGRHKGDKVIRIHNNGLEFVRIYSCCWGHTTNYSQTRIGCYSGALDNLA